MSDGVKSCAINTTSSLKADKSTTLIPNICLSILFVTSFISAALSFMYSLSIDSNMLTNISFISFKAYSAFTLSVLILSIAEPINSGSSKTNKCASNISASSAPNSSEAFSLTFTNSSLETATASSNLAISASTLSIDFFSITNSLCSTTNAFPKATPGEAPIPL